MYNKRSSSAYSGVSSKRRALLKPGVGPRYSTVVGYQGVRLSSGGLGGSFPGAKAPPGRAVSTPVGSSGGSVSGGIGDVGYQGVGSSSGGLGGTFRGAKAPPGCAVSTPVGSIGGDSLLKQVASYADVASVSVGGSVGGTSGRKQARCDQ